MPGIMDLSLCGDESFPKEHLPATALRYKVPKPAEHVAGGQGAQDGDSRPSASGKRPGWNSWAALPMTCFRHALRIISKWKEKGTFEAEAYRSSLQSRGHQLDALVQLRAVSANPTFNRSPT